jgi:membrane protein implicated in regulation of membrane protease activity
VPEAAFLIAGPILGALVFLTVADKKPQKPPRRQLAVTGPQEWRASRASMTVVWLAYLGLVAGIGGDALLVQQAPWWEPLVLAVVLSPILLVVWWPRLAVSNDEVVVRNLRTRRLRLRDVALAEPGREGIQLQLRSGKYVTAVAVQKSNLAYMRGWTTRADQVCAVINDRVAG